MAKGAEAEQKAEAFLARAGLKTITRNYLCNRGELDLVMLHNNTLVFVEVRLRSHRAFGTGAESVTLAKQQKLRLAAEHFLQTNPDRRHQPARFDVVWFDDLQAEPQWLTNAF